LADADIATVYALFANRAEAETIGRAMIADGHAACVNILGACTSIYRWEGRVETATEVPALFKVAVDRAEALIAAIAARHSYDVPAVVAWSDLAVHPPYAAWLATPPVS
jgi:periplasmic divalent cation tolerance protein